MNLAERPEAYAERLEELIRAAAPAGAPHLRTFIGAQFQIVADSVVRRMNDRARSRMVASLRTSSVRKAIVPLRALASRGQRAPTLWSGAGL